jgi:hypothetical protein
MWEIDVLVERVEGARLDEKVNESSPSNYSLNVSMQERGRDPQSLVLGFALELTSEPQLGRLVVNGIATITGSKEEINKVTTAPDDKNPPIILLTIYERVYGLLYQISGELKIPHPKPNLLKPSEGKEK